MTELGETVVRELEGIGTLTFENHGPGEWLTKKGEPAKVARRRYLLDDQELDSVSSIVDTLSKPALYAWYETQATLGAVQAERMGELTDVHRDGYVERVKSLGLGASAKRDEGADRGQAIHAVFHALAQGDEPPSTDAFPAIARPWVRGAYKAWMELDPALIEAESITCHPELGYAGRPDLIAHVGGVVTLIDYKTGKGRVFDQAHYQTRFYEMAKRAEGFEIERIVIVGIDDQGSFEPIDCETTDEDALALLHTFRSRKRVNAGMARQRAEARKLAKAAA